MFTFNFKKSVSNSRLLLCCLSKSSSNNIFISAIGRPLNNTAISNNPGFAHVKLKLILDRLKIEFRVLFFFCFFDDDYRSSGTSLSTITPISTNCL